MTGEEKKNRLKEVVAGFGWPVHCASCDEWRCDPEGGDPYYGMTDEQAAELLREIESWGAS